MGGCMGAPGARRRVLNLKDRTKVATRTAAKFISPFFSPSSCTYCILPHPFPVSALAAPVSLSVSAGIIVRLNPAAPSPAAWPLSWDAGALPRQLRPSTARDTPPRPRPTRPRLHHPPSRLAAPTACSALIPGHTGTPPPLVVHSSLPDPLLVPSWPLATPPRPAPPCRSSVSPVSFTHPATGRSPRHLAPAVPPCFFPSLIVRRLSEPGRQSNRPAASCHSSAPSAGLAAPLSESTTAWSCRPVVPPLARSALPRSSPPASCPAPSPVTLPHLPLVYPAS